MKKLELKHIAPYLPYDVSIEPIYKSMHGGGYYQKTLDASILDNYELEEIKPILRPLSDLDLCEEITTHEDLQDCIYSYVLDLISEHYDVFGLIEQGLAIDINTL